MADGASAITSTADSTSYPATPLNTHQPFFSSQIIAILAAILFPVFARAREKAKQASCQSNMKQIGLALHSYIQDYDERFMREAGYCDPATVLDDDPDVYAYWWQQLDPYMKNLQILACPSDTYTRVYSGGVSDTSHGYNVDYAINIFLPTQPISSVQAPANNIAVVESANNYARWHCPAELAAGKTNYAWTTNRHNDTSNYLFVDGHVKTLKLGPIGATAPPATPDTHMDLTFHP